MAHSAPNRDTDPLETIALPGVGFFALLFLLFLQLLSDLIETTYVFGLLGTSIPPEIVSVLFLLAPLLLILLPGAMESRTFAAVNAVIALLCRAAAVLMPTAGKMLLSGLGAGLILLFLASLLWQLRGHKVLLRMGLGLAFSSLVLMLLRAISFGTDRTSIPGNTSTVFGLVILTGVAVVEWQRYFSGPKPPAPADDVTSNASPLTAFRAAGLGIGIFSALALLYFGLTSPAVISRWSEASYPAIALLLPGIAALWLGLWAAVPRFRARLTAPRALELLNGFFLIALAVLLFTNRVDFPADPAAYPLAAPAPSPFAWLALFAVLLLHPVIFVDFALLAQALIDGLALTPRPRLAAAAVFAGALWLLLISFAHVFTTVYDYIPIIGPLFRDRFWMVYTAAGLGMALPLLLTRPRLIHAAEDALFRPRLLALYAGLLFTAAAVLPFITHANPPAAPMDAPTLRVLTYNIQQGYTEEGQKGFNVQLETIYNLNPDIIGLQESDTARIAGGNADVVRYFADRLDYYSYYGPSTVTGTFGIALLSRYPIENPQTFFMYSEGEQTAAILATIRAGDTPYTVLVTHLGNGGPLIQQQQVLQILEGRQNVIAMGDFNFRPGSEQYALTTAQYEDAWEVAADQELQQPDLNPGRKIDHVFITPGLPVLRGYYIAPGPSDHPGLLVEIGR